MARLFVDISSHGLGHLAQTAPVLNALRVQRPDLQLSVRSGLPRERLARRIQGDFTHLPAAGDFGFAMRNALELDLPASAARYRAFHADWPARVAGEAEALAALRPDLVLANVAYLPLAGAAAAGIPALALCSLNWAELAAACFRGEPWLAQAHPQMLAAYRSARAFLRATPGMAMADLPRLRPIGPLAATEVLPRTEVARRLDLPARERWVLVALGGFDYPLPVAAWPRHPGVHWLEADVLAGRDVAFADLLASADALVGKPGYGSFVEAAVHGVPLLYLSRPDWPEEPCLVEWLRAHGRTAEVSRAQAMRGDLLPALERLWATPAPPRPAPTGVGEAVATLLELLP